MKSNWIVVLCLLACLMLPSCGPHMYKTMSSGTDDVAYVIVIKENTDRTSYDDVQLVIDGSTCFYGKVYKQKAKRKAPVVTVKPGKHNLRVVIDGIVHADETVFVCASCSSNSQLYNWKGYEQAVYAYTQTPDEQNLEKLLTVYDRLLHAPGGVRMVPPPGVCADYGYLLLMNGKTDEGKALLEQETVLYPESKKFIDRILKRFE